MAMPSSGASGTCFSRNVSITVDPQNFYVQTIPEQTFMIYQLMFAIITPALITGAFAERMKFSAMALFLSLWSLLVYCPMAHMVWGVGGLLNTGRGPAVAGSGFCRRHRSPRHSRGLAALVTALYLGKRIVHPQTNDAAPLPGAQFRRRRPAVVRLVRFQRRKRSTDAGPPATSAFINTQFATATGAIGWPSPSGCTTASPRPWAPSLAWLPDWWPLLRLQALCSHFRHCYRTTSPASSAPSWCSR